MIIFKMLNGLRFGCIPDDIVMVREVAETKKVKRDTLGETLTPAHVDIVVGQQVISLEMTFDEFLEFLARWEMANGEDNETDKGVGPPEMN